MLLEIPHLNKMITRISLTHDISALSTLLSETILVETSSDIKCLSTIFKGSLNLKITYAMIENVVATTISHSEQIGINERCHQILVTLKDINEHDFNQGVLFLLRSNTLSD